VNILGHGIDVVSVPRIAAQLGKSDELVAGWFTSRELDLLGSRCSQAAVVGGRIAAKEAVVKALGCGFNDDVAWQDVEIWNTAAGAPTVQLSGGAATVAAALGVSSVLVSISHTPELATASAIAVGP
jgi:holo-[acyl-carrier protein] synthase